MHCTFFFLFYLFGLTFYGTGGVVASTDYILKRRKTCYKVAQKRKKYYNIFSNHSTVSWEVKFLCSMDNHGKFMLQDICEATVEKSCCLKITLLWTIQILEDIMMTCKICVFKSSKISKGVSIVWIWRFTVSHICLFQNLFSPLPFLNLWKK